MNAIAGLYQSIASAITRYFEDIALLLLRFMGGKVFFESGLTKWNGWFDFNEQKYDLFLYEFFCPDPVREGALLLCDPKTLDYEEGSSIVSYIESLALMAGVMEIVLPVLLVLGLFTRVGALGLLGMALFIQFAVFPTWEHWWNPAAWWAVVLFAVFARGPGLFSLDRILKVEK
jgi:putative oxidoreductase